MTPGMVLKRIWLLVDLTVNGVPLDGVTVTCEVAQGLSRQRVFPRSLRHVTGETSPSLTDAEIRNAP